MPFLRIQGKHTLCLQLLNATFQKRHAIKDAHADMAEMEQSLPRPKQAKRKSCCSTAHSHSRAHIVKVFFNQRHRLILPGVHKVRRLLISASVDNSGCVRLGSTSCLGSLRCLYIGKLAQHFVHRITGASCGRGRRLLLETDHRLLRQRRQCKQIGLCHLHGGSVWRIFLIRRKK